MKKKEFIVKGNHIEFEYSELSDFGKEALTSKRINRNKKFTISEASKKSAESKKEELLKKLNSL